MKPFLLLFCFLAFSRPVAAAEDINELRTLVGITVGDFSLDGASADMRSMEGNLSCGCPDFCLRQVTGPGGVAADQTSGDGTPISFSARWSRRGGLCGATLMTLETDAVGIAAGIRVPGTALSFGATPEQIFERYGAPLRGTDIHASQTVYCEVAEEVALDDPRALTVDLIHYAFLFIGGRLGAVRVGIGRDCPQFAFVPPV